MNAPPNRRTAAPAAARFSRRPDIPGTRFTSLSFVDAAAVIATVVEEYGAVLSERTSNAVAGHLVSRPRYVAVKTAALLLCGVVPGVLYLANVRTHHDRFMFSILPEGPGARVSAAGTGRAIDLLDRVFENLPR
ncbi:MAG: hypothetical protein AB7L13_15735 [Acidimicrobiia bacterium]